MRPRHLLPALAALAAALAAAHPAGAALRVLAPPDGAVVADKAVKLIGTGAREAIEATLNGKKTTAVKQVGDAFTGALELAPGENVVIVRSGQESIRVVYRLDAKAPLAYRFHPPVEEGDCKSCHPQGVGRTTPVSEAKLCHTCHNPKTGAKYLHGPIGAGLCVICHDPHGSAYPKLLVTGGRLLCMQCHAQSRTKSHIEGSASRQCPECHDPHGSAKQYLLY